MTGRGCLAACLAGLLLAACDGLGIGGGGERIVAAQIVHPNGAVLQVNSLRRGSDAVAVAATILNGRNGEISLNSGREQSYILTGEGVKLPLVSAAQNGAMAVPAGRMADLTMVFEGELPSSGEATLVLNANGSASNRFASAPRFEVALPLDGLGTTAIAEASGMSGLRALSASSLRRAGGAGSSLGSGAQASSSLTKVEALRSELGARQTERGTLVSLPGDITFDFDKATIKPAAREVLDRLAELIAAQDARSVSIEGHTDSKGEDAYNQKLSEERAEAVKAYLVGKGIAASKLATRGFGKTRPVADNTAPDGSDNEAGRQRNRRVEVILSGSGEGSEGSGAS